MDRRDFLKTAFGFLAASSLSHLVKYQLSAPSRAAEIVTHVLLASGGTSADVFREIGLRAWRGGLQLGRTPQRIIGNRLGYASTVRWLTDPCSPVLVPPHSFLGIVAEGPTGSIAAATMAGQPWRGHDGLIDLPLRRPSIACRLSSTLSSVPPRMG